MYRAPSQPLGRAMQLCTQPGVPRGIEDGVINRFWKLSVLHVHAVRRSGGVWPLPFMAAWELETLQPVVFRKHFMVPWKFMSLQSHTAQVCS
jgi:hypothetical protein